MNMGLINSPTFGIIIPAKYMSQQRVEIGSLMFNNTPFDIIGGGKSGMPLELLYKLSNLWVCICMVTIKLLFPISKVRGNS